MPWYSPGLIDKYDSLSAPLANTVIGSISSDLTRTNNAAGESALGDVIADAQLASTKSVGFGEAVVAFMNPGGIRGNFLFADISGGEAVGEVTFSEAFTVQPFGNRIDHTTIMINNIEVDPATNYRVTVNSFLADGGDNFSVLIGGTNRLGGEVDLDALVTYFGANSPVGPGPQDRITKIN